MVDDVKSLDMAPKETSNYFEYTAPQVYDHISPKRILHYSPLHDLDIAERNSKEDRKITENIL